MVGERIATEHVIAVDPGREESRTESKTAVDRGALTAVGLADPGRQPRFVFLDDLNEPIDATAVENFGRLASHPAMRH